MATNEIQSTSSPPEGAGRTSVGKLILIWIGALVFTLWAARVDALFLAVLAMLVAGQAPQGAVGILGVNFLWGSVLSAASAPFWYFIMRRGVGTGVKVAWVLISLYFVLNTVGIWAEMGSLQPAANGSARTEPAPWSQEPVPWYQEGSQEPVPESVLRSINDCMDKDNRDHSGRPASVDTGSGIGVRTRVFPYEDSTYNGAWPEGHRLTVECSRLMADDRWYRVHDSAGREGWVWWDYLRF